MNDKLSKQFQLWFIGPVNDKPETMRSIKATFLADLDIDLEEAQRIITEAPTIITSSDDILVIEKQFSILTRAGANVEKKDSKEDTTLIVDDTEENSSVEFEFDIQPSEPAEQKIWALEINETIESEIIGETKKVEDTPITNKASEPLLFSLETEDEPKLNTEIKEENKPDLLKKNDDKFDLSLSLEEDTPVIPEPVIKSTPPEEIDLSINFENKVEDKPAPTIDSSPKISSPGEIVFETEEKNTPEVKEQKIQSKDVVESVTERPIVQAKSKQEMPLPDQRDNKQEIQISPIEEDQELEDAYNFPKINEIKKTTTFREIVLPILTLGLILFAANYWYFQVYSKPKDTTDDLLTLTNELGVPAKKKKMEKLPTPVPVAIPTHNYLGSYEDSLIKVNATCKGTITELLQCELKITTQEPADLTIEEIAAKKKKLWVEKIISEKIDLVQGEGTGPARIYVEYGDRKDRPKGDIKLQTIKTVKGSETSFSLEAEVLTDKADGPDLNKLYVEAKDNGVYSIFLKTIFPLSITEIAPVKSIEQEGNK